MNVFIAVKENVKPMDAARLYGLKVTRNGMCVCPFHNDKHPSMKIDDRIGGGFYCFGCQVSGDVITFTAKLFGISKFAAASKLAEDFKVTYDKDDRNKPVEESETAKERKRKIREEHDFQTRKRDLSNLILKLLSEMREEKFLSESEAMKVLESNNAYVWIIHRLDVIEDLYDQLINRTSEEVKTDIDDIEKEVMKNAGEFQKIRLGCKRAS